MKYSSYLNALLGFPDIYNFMTHANIQKPIAPRLSREKNNVITSMDYALYISLFSVFSLIIRINITF